MSISARGREFALDTKKVQGNGLADAADKETVMCERRWCKPPTGFAGRAPTWGNGIVGTKKRRGSKRAALAVGHSIFVIYYQMIKTGQQYQEKGEAFFERKDHGKVERQLVRRLERMGYQVTLPLQPIT